MEKKNILVLDNTTSLVSPWKAEIKKYFNLIEAVGGFEALAKLKSDEYVLAIINLSIRTFDGLDAVRKIREKYPQLPIIVLADKSDVRFIKNAAMFGIHGYFFLPVEVTDLLSLVQKLSGVNLIEIANALAREEKEKEEQKVAKEKEEELEDVPAMYYEGQSHLARGEIQQAIEVFNQILNVKRLKDTWRRYMEDSYFQMGRCYLKLGDYRKAIELFSQFIQKAPTSQYNKTAYFLTAECYEKLNDIQKAINIYKKLVNMPPFDSVSTQARKKLKKLQAV